MTTATARRTTRKPAAAAIAAGVALTLPALAKGETYVGAIAGPDGRGHHVILLAGDKELTWSAALEWAKSIGGDLPDRVEQALLFAHHKKQFEARAYWSNTQYADDSSYAWYQYFDYGTRATTPQGLQAQSPRGPQSAPLTIAQGEQHERTGSVLDAQPRRSRGSRAARGRGDGLPRADAARACTRLELGSLAMRARLPPGLRADHRRGERARHLRRPVAATRASRSSSTSSPASATTSAGPTR
jgi:hypothetical protein